MLKLTVKTNEDNSYKFAPFIKKYALQKPCRVVWDDEETIEYTDIRDIQYQFKNKKEKYTVLIKELNCGILTFREDQNILEVDGIIPYLPQGALRYFYASCSNLQRISDDNFNYNYHQSDLSSLFENDRELTIDLNVVLNKFTNINNIDRIIKGCKKTIMLRQLGLWAASIVTANESFSDLTFNAHIEFNMLDNCESLVQANKIFFGSCLLRGRVPRVFGLCYKLEEVEYAFGECPNVKPDANWLYWLPSTITTPKDKIFDSKINEMLLGI